MLLAGGVYDPACLQQGSIYLLLEGRDLRLKLCQRAGRRIREICLGLRDEKIRSRVETRCRCGENGRVGRS
jgi:hypothetical protein